MNFRIRGLSPEPFKAIFDLDDAALAARGAQRVFADDMIVEADVVDGSAIESAIEQYFQREEVSYLHLHYAGRGCYVCRVDRVQRGSEY